MEVTYGVRYLPLLQRWVVKNPKRARQGDWPPKFEYWEHWLDIAGGCKTACGEHGGNLWGEVYTFAKEVGGWESENERGRGIDPQNLNIKCASSILLGSVKRLAESMVVTYGVRCMYSLGGWVVRNPQMSGAGGLTPKIQISSAPARYRWWCETVHGEHGGDLWGEVFALVREVGGREPKIERGRGIDPQNRIFQHTSSISIGTWNFQLVHTVRTNRVQIWAVRAGVVSELGHTFQNKTKKSVN